MQCGATHSHDRRRPRFDVSGLLHLSLSLSSHVLAPPLFLSLSLSPGSLSALCLSARCAPRDYPVPVSRVTPDVFRPLSAVLVRYIRPSPLAGRLRTEPLRQCTPTHARRCACPRPAAGRCWLCSETHLPVSLPIAHDKDEFPLAARQLPITHALWHNVLPAACITNNSCPLACRAPWRTLGTYAILHVYPHERRLRSGCNLATTRAVCHRLARRCE